MGDWLKINGGESAHCHCDSESKFDSESDPIAFEIAEAIFATQPWKNGPYGEGPTKITTGS